MKRSKKLKAVIVMIVVFAWIFSGWPQIFKFPPIIKTSLGATETKYASSHITGTFTNPTNANGPGTGSWAGDLNTNTSYTSRWAMEDPSGTLNSTQTISVLARKGSNSNNPTIALNLYENGVLVKAIIGDTTITSTSGQTVSGTFDSADITNETDVEIEVVQTNAGGSPSARNSAQIDYIQWDVNYNAPTAPTISSNAASSITSSSATLNGNITATGGANSTVRGFAWGTNSSLSGGDTATTTENGSFGTGSFTTNLSTLSAETTYYFRAYATNSGGTGYGSILNFTTNPANTLPVASGVSIDSGAATVTLNEGTTKNVSCVGTVTDNDGFADITSVKADFYRTSIGIGSALDDNNHYQLSGDSNCIPSGGSGNSETYTCDFSVQYFADPTDASSPNSGDDWTCTMTPNDSVGSGTTASDTIEMGSLIALDVTSSINYGTINPDQNTGSTNQTATVTNTGNRDMDPQISGTNMTDGGNSIAVENQKYSASAFDYSSAGTILTTVATTLNLTLPQQTDGGVTDIVYWGLGVPSGTPAGSYSGTNTFAATAGI